MKNIHFISGDKGGVGKSWFTLFLVNYYVNKEHQVLLIDTDNGNPDTSQPYIYAPDAGVEVKVITLDDSEGWLILGDLVEETPQDTEIIINHGARGNAGALEHGVAFLENCHLLNANLYIYWLINTELQGLVSLNNFKSLLQNGLANVKIVKNQYFGKNFKTFEESKLKTELEQSGGSSIEFPCLPLRLAEQIRLKSLHFGALDELTTINRLTTETFIQRATNAFEV